MCTITTRVYCAALVKFHGVRYAYSLRNNASHTRGTQTILNYWATRHCLFSWKFSVIILSVYMQIFVILAVNAHKLNKINKFMGLNNIYLICKFY